MSLILDALNRADQERNVENKAPDLQATHMSHAVSNHKMRRWIIEAVIIACVILTTAVYFFRDNSTQTTDDDLKTVDKVIKREPTKVTETPTQPTVAAQQTARVSKPPVVNSAAIKPSKQPVRPPANQAISSLYKQSSATNTTAIANKGQITSTEQKAVEPQKDITQSILLSIPLLSEQSENFQRAVPSIEYSMHAYTEQGGFVMLNGRRYRVGDSLTPELRVIAILQNSLVLDHKGRQFRLLALNSWINL